MWWLPVGALVVIVLVAIGLLRRNVNEVNRVGDLASPRYGEGEED